MVYLADGDCEYNNTFLCSSPGYDFDRIVDLPDAILLATINRFGVQQQNLSTSFNRREFFFLWHREPYVKASIYSYKNNFDSSIFVMNVFLISGFVHILGPE